MVNIFCHEYAKNGSCPFGDRCRFPTHVQLCTKNGTPEECPFGDRCHFGHLPTTAAPPAAGHDDPFALLSAMMGGVDVFGRAMGGGAMPALHHAAAAPHHKAVAVKTTAPAPSFKLGERVKARFSPTSVSWKDATVARLHPGRDPELVFDGFANAVPVPAGRIQKQKQNLPAVAAAAGPRCADGSLDMRFGANRGHCKSSSGGGAATAGAAEAGAVAPAAAARALPWHGKLATNIRALLAEAPGGEVPGATFGTRYLTRFREPLLVDKERGEKLQDLLRRAEASGSCRLELRPAAPGPDGKVHGSLLFVHAPDLAVATGGGKKGASGKGASGKGASGKGASGGGGGGRAWDDDDSDGDSSHSSSDSFKGRGGGGGKKKATPCWYFAKGNCLNGDKCHNAHSSGGSGGGGGGAGASAAAAVCRAFARGHCPNGAACGFAHPQALIDGSRALAASPAGT
jgi:hypothetical protein